MCFFRENRDHLFNQLLIGSALPFKEAHVHINKTIMEISFSLFIIELYQLGQLAMSDVLDCELSLEDRVAMLSDDQRCILDDVNAHQQCHEALVTSNHFTCLSVV